MLITKEIGIDMGHRIPNHKSKCRNLHGHRYKIEVGVDDKVIDLSGASDEGMVIDFSDLKEIMMRQIDQRYDHNAVFFKGDSIWEIFDGVEFQDKEMLKADFIPTAENLAKHWFSLLQPSLFGKHIKLHHVTVWETPTSTAMYSIKDKENETR